MKIKKIQGIFGMAAMAPLKAVGQDTFEGVASFHQVLQMLYDQMMPLCSSLIGVGQGIAGFAALWFVSSRVWKHLAAAESIDFYPLFRPFVIGFCISFFPMVMGVINGVLTPIVSATSGMVGDSNRAITELLDRKREAMERTDHYQMYIGPDGQGNRDQWYRYSHPESDPGSEGFWEGIGNDYKFAMSKAAYSFRNSVKEWLGEVLAVLFQAAALCIDTLRTFQLVVLSVLGPLVFGLAVFDGFQHTLVIWLARYINIFLWLPVANIFGSMIGKIQENMLKIDISQIQQDGQTFFSQADAAYLLFLIIGIVGYFSVPSIANYIVNASENGAFVRSVTNIFQSSAASLPTKIVHGGGAMANDSMGDSAARNSSSMAQRSLSEPYFAERDASNGYMGDKLKGNG